VEQHTLSSTKMNVPAKMGDLTILSHHAPLVTALRLGELRIVDAGGAVTVLPVALGIFEVGSNEAVVFLYIIISL
jgi:F0F1-type ATP synthase epsilon subunit